MARRFSVPTTVLVALLLAAGSLEAQEQATQSLLGIGYVSNAPEELLGGTIWGVIPGFGGWGLYLDAKMDPEDPVGDGFLYNGMTSAEVEQQWPNDLRFVSVSRWWGLNVAITKVLTDDLVVYAGGGYAEETVYRQYHDWEENRGVLGWYWAEDPDTSRTGVNVLAGGLMRISDAVRIQFGGESRPMGFTVGLSFVLGDGQDGE